MIRTSGWPAWSVCDGLVGPRPDEHSRGELGLSIAVFAGHSLCATPSAPVQHGGSADAAFRKSSLILSLSILSAAKSVKSSVVCLRSSPMLDVRWFF